MKIITAVLITLIFSGCLKDKITANGNMVEVVRDIEDFSGIRKSGATNVHVDYGEVYEVKLKGSSNLVEHFKTNVSGTTLSVGYRHVNVHDSDIEVFIKTPGLNKVKLSGSGNVYLRGNFPADDAFNAEISGSGDIHLTGSMKFNSFDANISGSGKINLLSLETKHADISISGSGDVQITATEKLKAKISGSGKVYYSGNATVSSNIGGSGKVVKI